jgi:hypothetical protein
LGKSLLLVVMSQDEQHHHHEGGHHNQDHSISAEERLRRVGRAVSLMFVFVYHVLTDFDSSPAGRAQNNPRSASLPGKALTVHWGGSFRGFRLERL